jgi:hypothetical protein
MNVIVKASKYTPVYAPGTNIDRYWRKKDDSTIWIEITDQKYVADMNCRLIHYRNALEVGLKGNEATIYTMTYPQLLKEFENMGNISSKF